jgi:predicted outer membrane lipoprotein
VSDRSWHRPWVYGVLGLLACAVLMLIAVALDRHENQARPMYEDVFRMAELQTRNLKGGGEVAPVELTDDDEVTVRDRSFRPSDGVRVQVVADGDGYCVRGWNQHGDSTRWLCGDDEATP